MLICPMYGGLVSLSFASASVSHEETMMPSPTVGLCEATDPPASLANLHSHWTA
jgi:hypothetical protein